MINFKTGITSEELEEAYKNGYIKRKSEYILGRGFDKKENKVYFYITYDFDFDCKMMHGAVCKNESIKEVNLEDYKKAEVIFFDELKNEIITLEEAQERYLDYKLIKAYYNESAVDETQERPYGVVIEQKNSDEVDFESFKTEYAAIRRVSEINALKTDKWENI